MLQSLRKGHGTSREGAQQLPSAIKPEKVPRISIVPLQGIGRKEAHNVRPGGPHPRLDLTIAHFR